jgi:hypothetical protein
VVVQEVALLARSQLEVAFCQVVKAPLFVMVSVLSPLFLFSAIKFRRFFPKVLLEKKIVKGFQKRFFSEHTQNRVYFVS